MEQESLFFFQVVFLSCVYCAFPLFKLALNMEEKGKRKKKEKQIKLELKAIPLDVQAGQVTGTVEGLRRLLTSFHSMARSENQRELEGPEMQIKPL